MNFRLIGAAALSLVLATPAMAMHQRYHLDQGRVIHSKLPVLESPEYGDGSTYRAYNLSPATSSLLTRFRPGTTRCRRARMAVD
jgi:hypothetical protein